MGRRATAPPPVARCALPAPRIATCGANKAAPAPGRGPAFGTARHTDVRAAQPPAAAGAAPGPARGSAAPSQRTRPERPAEGSGRGAGAARARAAPQAADRATGPQSRATKSRVPARVETLTNPLPAAFPAQIPPGALPVPYVRLADVTPLRLSKEKLRTGASGGIPKGRSERKALRMLFTCKQISRGDKELPRSCTAALLKRRLNFPGMRIIPCNLRCLMQKRPN